MSHGRQEAAQFLSVLLWKNSFLLSVSLHLFTVLAVGFVHSAGALDIPRNDKFSEMTARPFLTSSDIIRLREDFFPFTMAATVFGSFEHYILRNKQCH